MFEEAQIALEWDQVVALVARHIGSPLGAAELEKVAPSIAREALVHSLADTAEAIQYLRAASAPQATGQGAAIRIHFNGLPNVTIHVQKLHIQGAALEP